MRSIIIIYFNKCLIKLKKIQIIKYLPLTEMQKYKPFLTINLFVSPPSSIYNLICPLCGGILYNPVKDSCGHHFCMLCIYHYKQTNRICPISSSLFETMSNYPDIQLKHIINSQTIICKNFNLGCSWTGLVSEYQQHLESDCDIQRWIYHNEPIFGLKEEINKDKNQEGDVIEIKEEANSVSGNEMPSTTNEVSTIESNCMTTNKTLKDINSHKENNRIDILVDVQKNQYFDLNDSKEIEIVGDGIITRGNSNLPKFVFSTLSFDPSETKVYKWKVKVTIKSNWLFIGMCNKIKVKKNNYIFSDSKEGFESGIYGISTNCVLWNSSNIKENIKSIFHMPRGIKSEIIDCEYHPKLRILYIVLIQSKCKIMINKIEENGPLCPCFIYYEPGNEIEFIE